MKDFQLLIYSTPSEDIKVDVILKGEDIWASQKAMSALFGVQVPDISKHIKNIFETGELEPDSTAFRRILPGGKAHVFLCPVGPLIDNFSRSLPRNGIVELVLDQESTNNIRFR